MPLILFFAFALGIPLVFSTAGALDQLTGALTRTVIGGILAFAALQLIF